MANNMPDTIPSDFMAALAHLGSRDELGIDEMKLMVLLETSGDPLYQKLASLAPKGETNGDAGYQNWANHEPNPEIAELLRQNGREEIRHGERVARVAEILKG